MGGCRLHIMIVSTLVYIYILHRSLASSCDTGDIKTYVITQHPPKVEAKYGDKVSFTCVIDGDYNVSRVSVVKDKVSVLIRNVSHIISKDENIFFEGTNYNFTLTVLVRNKTDSNTYYCEALEGDPSSHICGAGTFINIIDTGSTNYIPWVILGVVVPVILIGVYLLYKYKKEILNRTSKKEQSDNPAAESGL